MNNSRTAAKLAAPLFWRHRPVALLALRRVVIDP